MAHSLSSTPWVTRTSQEFAWILCIDSDHYFSTGYGQHGDYLFGWDGDSLQRAMDTCTDTAGVPTGCRALTTLSDAEINKCTKAEQVPENNSGCKQPRLRLKRFTHMYSNRPPPASRMQPNPERTWGGDDASLLHSCLYPLWTARRY